MSHDCVRTPAKTGATARSTPGCAPSQGSWFQEFVCLCRCAPVDRKFCSRSGDRPPDGPAVQGDRPEHVALPPVIVLPGSSRVAILATARRILGPNAPWSTNARTDQRLSKLLREGRGLAQPALYEIASGRNHSLGKRLRRLPSPTQQHDFVTRRIVAIDADDREAVLAANLLHEQWI